MPNQLRIIISTAICLLLLVAQILAEQTGYEKSEPQYSGNELFADTQIENQNNSIHSETSSQPSSTIQLNKTNYKQFKVFQRDASNEYDFNLFGNYSGVCSEVEASFDDQPYVTIDANPSGGTFSGTLANQGIGQGRISVRCSNDPTAESGVNNIGIGDVYVVAGQSNAEGHGLVEQHYTTVAPTTDVFPTVYTQTDTWKIANDDTDPGGGPGSVWPLLGGYITENTGIPVNFITTATGGSSLNTEWQPGTSIFNSFASQIAETNVNAVKAVLWFQGESDVDDQISRNTYNTLLDQLIANFQSNAPGTPDLVAGILGPRIGNNNQIYTTGIRLATQDAWDDNPSILQGPQTYDIHITNDGEGDNIHFGTNEEIQTLAFRWWKAIEQHYYSGNEGRGPQVIGAQLGSGNTSIDVDFDANSSLQGGTSTSIWLVDDNGNERIVTNAFVLDNNTVRLTLDQATTSNNVTLSYAKGNSGENQDVLTDSTTGNAAAGTSPLPANVFSDFVVTPYSGPATFQLEAAVILEGPYKPNSGLMNDDLRKSLTFPISEPYTALDFVNVNSGGEFLPLDVLAKKGSNALVDWIFIEIRDGNNPTNVIQTQAGLLQRDGDIVSTDGANLMSFDYPDPSITSIVVAVKHRNHLGYRNLIPIDIEDLVSIDFTDINLPLYGDPGLAAKVVNGVYVMISGDSNNAGEINAVDKNLYWRLQNGMPYVYIESSADFNLNGIVNSIDKNLYWRPNNPRIEQLD